jgi:hypothetical protein
VSEATLHSRAKELVDRAKDHIYVATTQSNSSEWIAGDAAAHERAAYFKSLLDRAQEGKKYSRILQTRDYSQPITFGSPEYLKHLREMVAMRDSSNATPSISLSRSILGEICTFVLVDDTHLIWEIDRREPLEKESRFRGFFLVYDPTREIISTFEEIWRRMTFDMRQVTESDIVLPGASASNSSGDPNPPTT